MNTRNLPSGDSISELARFWDAHEVTAYDGELEEVVEPVFEKRPTIAFDIDPAALQALKRMAATQGIDFAALARQWVMGKIENA